MRSTRAKALRAGGKFPRSDGRKPKPREPHGRPHTKQRESVATTAIDPSYAAGNNNHEDPPRPRASVRRGDGATLPLPPAARGTANSRTRRHTHRRLIARTSRRGRKVLKKILEPCTLDDAKIKLAHAGCGRAVRAGSIRSADTTKHYVTTTPRPAS